MDFIQSNCTTVFINVNVHFFLDDNCEGDLASVADPYLPNDDPDDEYEFGDFNPHNAFFLGEKLVNDANAFITERNLNLTNQNHQWHQAIHGAMVTDFECIPMQFVLNGTRIHCDSDAQVNLAFGEGFSDFTDYMINTDSEINVFVTKIPDAGGYTYLEYHSFVTQQIDHWAASPNFIHEMFHDLSLNHSFSHNDQCNDTWPSENWTFDLNLDGDTSDDGESGRGCWTVSVDEYNGMDPCNENDYPETHYCCDWGNIDNNIMNYSSSAAYVHSSAITPCQVAKILDHVNTKKCDFIADVGSCPPPSAFIGRMPEGYNTSPCKSCFYLNASHNESGYSVDIMDNDGNYFLETGFIDNQAGKYCITARQDQFGHYYWPYDLESGEIYTLNLHVQNECGDFDDHAVSFELPLPCNTGTQDPDDKLLEVITLSPNPATEYVDVEFNLNDAGDVKVYGKYINAMNIYNNHRSEDKSPGDGQQITIDVSNWSPGINSVIFQFKNEIYIENIIKQ